MNYNNTAKSDAAEVALQISTIRERYRIATHLRRERNRHEGSDSFRIGLNEKQEGAVDIENILEKDIEGLAKRIKRRKHATKDDMYRLSYGFIQSIDNIESFSRIPGAIQVLIKEFTGSNIENKLSAVECFCNLSLGKAPVCEKLAKMIGSYLVTFLNGKETQQTIICLWTIENILSSSQKACTILLQLELWPKLWHLYTEETTDESIIGSAGLCLYLITTNNRKDMRLKDLNLLKENIQAKNPCSKGAEYYLGILFNSNIVESTEMFNMESDFIIYLCNFAVRNINQVSSLQSFANRISVVFSVRTLANLFACEKTAPIVMHQLNFFWNKSITSLINNLYGLQDRHLSIELFWLLKNIVAFSEVENINDSFSIKDLNIFKFL